MHADVVGSTSLFRQHGLDVHDHKQSGLRRLSDAIRAYGGSTEEILNRCLGKARVRSQTNPLS
jgi:hypothetical protein